MASPSVEIFSFHSSCSLARSSVRLSSIVIFKDGLKTVFFHQNVQSKARVPFEYSDGKVMQIRAKLLKITPLPHLEVVKKKIDLVFEGSQYKDKFFSYIIRKCVLKIWPFLSVCSIWPFPSVCLIIEVGNKKRINHN